jgi:hypothetical protein
MDEPFVSYAFRDLPRKKIVKYAAQYEGVDMARLIGANEENFPFLIQQSDDSYSVMFWNVYHGIMVHLDEDQVRDYATANYLRKHAYPVFTSSQEAEKWAKENDWPRKPWPGGVMVQREMEKPGSRIT